MLNLSYRTYKSVPSAPSLKGTALKLPQLILMRHFSNPVSIFWKDRYLGRTNNSSGIQVLEDSSSYELRRFLASLASNLDEDDAADIGKGIDKARQDYRDRCRGGTVAFLVLLEVQKYLRTVMGDGYRELKASFSSLLGKYGSGVLKDICGRLSSRIRCICFSSQSLCLPFVNILAALGF